MDDRSVRILVVIDEICLPPVHKGGVVPLRNVGIVPPAPGVAAHDADTDLRIIAVCPIQLRTVHSSNSIEHDGRIAGSVFVADKIAVRVKSRQRSAAEHAHVVTCIGR